MSLLKQQKHDITKNRWIFISPACGWPQSRVRYWAGFIGVGISCISENMRKGLPTTEFFRQEKMRRILEARLLELRKQLVRNALDS